MMIVLLGKEQIKYALERGANDESKETCQEAVTIFQLKGGGGSDLSGSNKHNEKWLDFGYNLKQEPRAFAIRLGVRCKKKRSIKDD